MHDSELLKTAEAAKFLKVSPNTLNQWRSQARGPNFVKVGRCVRYRKSDLLLYIESSTHSNTYYQQAHT